MVRAGHIALHRIILAMDSIHLWPRTISLARYKLVFGNAEVMRSLGISVIVTLAGTAFSMLMSIMGGYSLSKKDMLTKRFIGTGAALRFD